MVGLLLLMLQRILTFRKGHKTFICCQIISRLTAMRTADWQKIVIIAASGVFPNHAAVQAVAVILRD
ncbi:hypothetical protein AV903_09655 [Erwinia tracheiphila]|uniref:Uncharacterized protein n=1 Tax=Erwinia tracheiphila TaxID=65700 RepID=A0A345CS33_9GAMM|nr:hypothetical protein AV903_09655 [Erwinia tracheiphila]